MQPSARSDPRVSGHPKETPARPSLTRSACGSEGSGQSPDGSRTSGPWARLLSAACRSPRLLVAAEPPSWTRCVRPSVDLWAVSASAAVSLVGPCQPAFPGGRTALVPGPCGSQGPASPRHPPVPVRPSQGREMVLVVSLAFRRGWRHEDGGSELLVTCLWLFMRLLWGRVSQTLCPV